jgi:hypothetical protein
MYITEFSIIVCRSPREWPTDCMIKTNFNHEILFIAKNERGTKVSDQSHAGRFGKD